MRSRSPVSMPMQQYSQSQQQPKKYYTREEVSQILRAMMENKLTKVYEQLQQKQQMIRSLNEKLNRNDNYLQSSSKQMLELAQKCSYSSQTQLQSTIELINKMINDKLQLYWHNVQSQLDKIRTDCHETITKYHQALQDKAGRMISQIRTKSEESVDNFKKKNNAYWIKVKQALNKMNARTVQSQQKITIIGMQINKFETEREENSKTLKQLQNGQNTAKMLVQLKKSVNNVYRNFQQVLKLQQAVKQRYQSMGSISKIGCEKCMHAHKNAGQSNKNNWALDRNKAKPKQDDIVILQYSIEQDTLSNHRMQNMARQQQSVRPYSKSVNQFVPRAGSPNKKSQGQTELFPLSPITGKVIEQSSINSNTMDLLGSERLKYQMGNMSTKNQTNEWGDHQQYLGPPNYGQFINNELQSNSFQLHNSTNPPPGFVHNSNSNSRFLYTPNPNSTSMLNFSLDCRKQMLESVKPRLMEMIQTKALAKPIRVFMDQINYLKNQEGNYLFDLKGNMFKLSPNQFAQLQKDRIIINVKNQEQRKGKRIN